MGAGGNCQIWPPGHPDKLRGWQLPGEFLGTHGRILLAFLTIPLPRPDVSLSEGSIGKAAEAQDL